MSTSYDKQSHCCNFIKYIKSSILLMTCEPLGEQIVLKNVLSTWTAGTNCNFPLTSILELVGHKLLSLSEEATSWLQMT